MAPSKLVPIRGQSSLDAFLGVSKDKSVNQGKTTTKGKQTKLDAFVVSSTKKNETAVKVKSKTTSSSTTTTTSRIVSPPNKSTSTTTAVVTCSSKPTDSKVQNKAKAKEESKKEHKDSKKDARNKEVATVTKKVAEVPDQELEEDEADVFEFVEEEEEEEFEADPKPVNPPTKKEVVPSKRVLTSCSSVGITTSGVIDHNKRQRTARKTYIDDDDDDDDDNVDNNVEENVEDNVEDDVDDEVDDDATVDMRGGTDEQTENTCEDEDHNNAKEASVVEKATNIKNLGNVDQNVDDDDKDGDAELDQADNGDDDADDESDTDEKSADEEMVEEVNKPLAISKKPTPTASKKSTRKSEVAAKGMKSDQQLLDSSAKIWEDDKDLPYLVLCEVFEQIEETSGRLEIQRMLTDLMRQVLLKHPQDMYALLYLASNSVAPAYECVELGIGDAILNKAIGEAFGTNPAMIKKKYADEGDLGTVAKLSKSMQRTLSFGVKIKPLLAKEVLQAFREIARMTGSKSQKAKVEKIKKVLVRAQPGEAKYVVRGLQGKLRIGLAQTTVLISLAHALALTTPKGVDDTVETLDETGISRPVEILQYSDKKAPLEKRLEAAVAIIKQAYSEVPSYDALLDAGLKVPLQKMYQFCTLTPGIPVSPMLAKPTKSIQEILKRLNGQTFTCEYKYDGERAQVHMLPDGTTKVFSRNLLDTSEKYPEVPLFVKEAAVDVTSFVLDAEVVAFNNKTGTLVPFQVLSTRKKTEESAETAKVQVIVQAFDLMFLNGKSLLKATFKERRELLHKHFQAVEGKFQFAKSMDHKENGDTTCIEEFLDLAVKGQCEGLMVKTLEENAVYEPSRRSLNWLKLKKDYLEGLGDSVDLVPLGAYHGRGKRTGVYGAYLLACYDAETEEFQSCCKLGTGFSDDDLKNLSDSLNEHRIPQKNGLYNVSDQLECDVWFDAVQVWEVKAADLSKSSVHSCAIGRTGEAGRGIGLRFPRFVRIRDDKKTDQATSSEQILEMYYNQGSITAQGGDEENEDYYAAHSDDEGI